MFDFSFPELIVIGVVALVVVGPERLPKVARVAGRWLGRSQRFMNKLAEDINREVEVDSIRQLHETAQAELIKIDQAVKEEEAKANTAMLEASQSVNSIGMGARAAKKEEPVHPVGEDPEVSSKTEREHADSSVKTSDSSIEGKAAV